jgi:hypothetical protein
MGQVYECWWMICREMFLQGSNIVCSKGKKSKVISVIGRLGP